MEKRSLKYHLFHVFEVVLILTLATAGYAGTWRDNFNDGELNGWTHVTKAAKDPWESTWESQENSLQTMLTVHFNNPRLGQVADFLQLTILPPREKHTVTEGISIKKEGGGSFGIAIGMLLPPEDRNFASVYLFSTTAIWAIKFDKTGGFDLFAGQNPVIRHKPQIDQMKIIFDAGRFQLFSGNQLIADFKDETFETIDLLGLMAWGFSGLHATIDDFVISGPRVPNGTGDLRVSPKNRLATKWGSLKREIPSF